MILFHHGSYFTGGKEAILEVIAGTAWGSVVWNTNGGQNLITVRLEHLITPNAVEHPDTIEYADPDRGVRSRIRSNSIGVGFVVSHWPRDLDGNGSVGASDLFSLLAHYGGTCNNCPFDGDGNVGATDLLALLVHWGFCP
ncbi:MAG: hypothetical protein V3T53_08085 [Phycisphaerales bacterium]